MKSRCTNKNRKEYDRYGGRGITVCGEWEDFANFYKDMGDLPFEGAQLDRIDNDKGYIIGNIQWVHKDINKMKWKFNINKFIQMCREVANYKKY